MTEKETGDGRDSIGGIGMDAKKKEREAIKVWCDEFCPHCSPCRNSQRIADAERLNISYDAVLRNLASFLGVGGHNDFKLIDPKVAEEKIRWGIDHVIEVEKKRAAPTKKREAFEAHQLRRYQYADVTQDTDGRYLNVPMESEWETWQAALAQPAQGEVDKDDAWDSNAERIFTEELTGVVGRINQEATCIDDIFIFDDAPQPPADTIAVPVAEYEAMKRDAERYQVLRMYKLSGAWPLRSNAPAGVLAFSSSGNGAYTQGTLDLMLDDMLGLVPSADKNVRADFQEWRSASTQKAIDAAKSTGEDV